MWISISKLANATSHIYSLNVDFHIEASECYVSYFSAGACSRKLTSSDVTDSAYYCFCTCTKDLTIASSPTSIASSPVSGASSTISVQSVNQFSGPVTFSAEGSDPSLHWSLNEQTATVSPDQSASSTLTVTVPSSTCKVGTFSVTVYAADGLGHSVNISVSETCPDFSMVAGSSTVDGCPGGTSAEQLTFSSLNGFFWCCFCLRAAVDY